MPRVIIEHPDGRQYGVELAAFFAQYQPQGFRVVRQLYSSDFAGVLGDPEAVEPTVELEAAAKEPGEPYEAVIVAPSEPPAAIVSGVQFVGRPVTEPSDAVG